jgi:phosphopantothenoylcysteine synthetase/decarboxylase
LVDGKEVSAGKAPSGGKLTLEMKPTGKLIAELKKYSAKPLKIAGFKLTSGSFPDERRTAAEKVLAHADLVLGNDLSEINESEGRHAYTAYTNNSTEELAGFNEMSGRLAQWILGKDQL